jgi:hypothetical protein
MTAKKVSCEAACALVASLLGCWLLYAMRISISNLLAGEFWPENQEWLMAGS